MRAFNNLSTSLKLMLGFALSGVITASIGWLGIANMGAINDSVESLYGSQLLPMIDLADMRDETLSSRLKTLHAAATNDPATAHNDIEAARDIAAKVEKRWGDFAAKIANSDERDAFQKYRDATKQYFAEREILVYKPLLAGKRDAAIVGLEQLAPYWESSVKARDEMVEIKKSNAQKNYDGSRAIYSASRFAMIGVVICSIAIGLAVGYWISRLITAPLSSIAATLASVAKGDLTQELKVTTADELGRTMQSLNATIVSLRQARQASNDTSLNLSATANVLDSASRAQSIDDACRDALDIVRREFGWAYGSFWRLDKAEKCLRFGVESGSVTEEFRRVTATARFREGEGLSGRAWRQRDLFFTPDIGQMTDCCRAPAAQRAGVKSGVCFPIIVRNEVFGTMDFFSTETLSPSKERLDALRNVGRTISAAIERVQRETEMARVSSMMEQTPINILFADRDLIIRYANPASSRTVREIEKYIPVKADQMIGQSIDLFHKQPEKQRRLLADPKNLPHRAIVDVGPEKIDLLVSAIYDQNRQYLGAMVTWDVITKRLEQDQAIKDAVVREKEAADELRSKVDAILEVVTAAAQGDLTREVAVAGEGSIDQLAVGLNEFLADLRGNMAKLAQNASSLAGSAEELTATSQQMGGNARETAAQAGVVSAASEQVSASVSTVATGIEEMSASIKEISKNASDAARVATEAVGVANSANTTVSKLGESSAEIGQVIKVITSIAQQTNLLALNATIEAARAGEAGKGFAVVANEVKELAKETARATEEIGQKIDAIQADTKGAVEAIGKIGTIIARINDISTTIASAVEEQTATTNEIGRSVGEVAKSSADIAQNITSVASASQSTTEGADNTQQAAGELARMASDLQQLVGQFKFERHDAPAPPQAPSRAMGRKGNEPAARQLAGR